MGQLKILAGFVGLAPNTFHPLPDSARTIEEIRRALANRTDPEILGLTAPVQIHHGTADRAVDIANTQNLNEALDRQRTPVELFTYEGVDHGFLAYTRPTYRRARPKRLGAGRLGSSGSTSAVSRGNLAGHVDTTDQRW